MWVSLKPRPSQFTIPPGQTAYRRDKTRQCWPQNGVLCQHPPEKLLFALTKTCIFIWCPLSRRHQIKMQVLCREEITRTAIWLPLNSHYATWLLPPGNTLHWMLDAHVDAHEMHTIGNSARFQAKKATRSHYVISCHYNSGSLMRSLILCILPCHSKVLKSPRLKVPLMAKGKDASSPQSTPSHKNHAANNWWLILFAVTCRSTRRGCRSHWPLLDLDGTLKIALEKMRFHPRFYRNEWQRHQALCFLLEWLCLAFWGPRGLFLKPLKVSKS